MKVLADLHHAELFYSLQLLFEKRLGWELYRPIGLDWYHQGYWKIFPHIDTANQYLGLNQAMEIPKDIHGNPLPESARVNQIYREEDGIFYVTDVTKGKINRGITLEKFKQTKFDILISSMPPHIQPFNQLIQRFQPQAKHIFQVGNAWGQQAGVKNILSSTTSFGVPPDINICFYHQEFDLDWFRYEPPTVYNKVYSYVHWMKGKDQMNACAKQLPDWEFKSFGANMESSICKTKDIANQMINSAFTWHFKPEGDGYGHTLHNTFACGRPAIIWGSHYKGKAAAKLFEHGVTCIDVEKVELAYLPQFLKQVSEPEAHAKMCEAAYNRFKEVVNFDEEEIMIRKFLEKLQ